MVATQEKLLAMASHSPGVSNVPEVLQVPNDTFGFGPVALAFGLVFGHVRYPLRSPAAPSKQKLGGGGGCQRGGHGLPGRRAFAMRKCRQEAANTLWASAAAAFAGPKLVEELGDQVLQEGKPCQTRQMGFFPILHHFFRDAHRGFYHMVDPFLVGIYKEAKRTPIIPTPCWLAFEREQSMTATI